jgi:hypothetical protein
MRTFSTLTLAGCMWLALGSQAAAEVRISITEGRVTLSARDATVRQILTEWARVGRTQIVNVERIAGGPITIEFTNVPETEALDMLLRSLSGYMVAPRAAVIADASSFDRIIVMPTSASPRPAPSASAAPPPAPFGQVNGIMQPGEDDNQAPAGAALPPALAPIFNNPNIPPNPNFPPNPNLQPGPGGGNPRRPGNTGVSPGPGLFGAVPPQAADPAMVAPQAGQQVPTAQPAANPFGAVSTPGMVAPAASQPGQLVPQVQQQRRSPNDN